MAVKPVRVIKNPIRERAKKIPLETRLYVFFQMDWLSMNVDEGRGHTEAEAKEASKFAMRMTKEVMKYHKQWVKDGSPTYKKNGRK